MVLFLGTTMGLMQMKSTKNYLANWIENDFSETYKAELKIGQLDGLIPFTLNMSEVTITAPNYQDSSRIDTLAYLQSAEANIDVLSLFQNKISITGFSLENPQINLYQDKDERYSLFNILRRLEREQEADRSLEASWVSNIEIVAPQLSIKGGGIYVERLLGNTSKLNLPEPLRITDINAEMFLEITSQQRFWDLESFTATVQNVKSGDLSVIGQIYNDDTYLEFNGFTFKAGNSQISLNGEIEGVDLFKQEVGQQLQNAQYNVDVNSSKLVLNDFSDILPNAPSLLEPIVFDIQTEGVIDSLYLDQFTLGVGESYFRIDGLFKNLSTIDNLSYDLEIAELSMRKQDLEILTSSLDQRELEILNNLAVKGSADGSLDSVNVDLKLTSKFGNVSLKGSSQLKEPFRYAGSVEGTSVNATPFFTSTIDTTNLNFNTSVTGIGTNISDAFMDLSTTIFNSTINNVDIERLELKSSLVSGLFEQEYIYRSGSQNVNGSGWIDLNSDIPSLAFKGNAEGINLAAYAASSNMPKSELNFDYNIELEGFEADRIQGRANLDVKESIVNGDTLNPHQLYMDLDSPDQESRTFRLTSSMFDLDVTGDIVPSNLLAMASHWGNYLSERFNEEILLDSVGSFAQKDSLMQQKISPMVLNGDFRSKDLSLIKKYWPEAPTLKTDLELDFNVNTDSSRMLFSTSMQSDTLFYNKWKTYDASAQLTASFQSNRKLKEFSNVDFQSKLGRLNTSIFDMDSVNIDVAFKEDSLRIHQHIGSISDNASMDLAMKTVLSDSLLAVEVDSFFLGNDVYAWQNQGRPKLSYNRKDELTFSNFRFKNLSEYFEIRGTLSPNRSDSLQYILRDIRLERISDLIDGRVSFAGAVNGAFQTRSLTNRPSIQGDLNISRLRLDNRMIGDARFTSTYNSENERFDTQIRVITDSTKYGEYLSENDDIGQNILIDGYFVPPNSDVSQDTVYNFDIDFNQIDMWVIPLFANKVFDSMEGQASGTGYLRGNLDDYDFHADFQTQNVFTKPRFLNTNYFLSGPVELDRDKGVVLDSVNVTDTKGGTGLLWGTVDLNNFDPITYLDINFRLNQLQFLNNAFDPDVPFYGNVSGTGLLRVTGSNTDMFIQTVEPIIVTESSKVSIPLLEQTELNEDSKFIKFVDEFDLSPSGRLNLTSDEVRDTELDEERLEQALDDLTFTERADLDLQFIAPQNINVDLIFDPVTGDVLTAQGTGQVRITMQDEDVQMFGSYNVTGGTYQFVSGEIISRRLSLERGGSISWEGNPGNARLNINAIYNARPNIANLNARGDLSEDDEDIQRVPIDLVIEIAGTVSSVENNYYFRLSNEFELSSNSTLSFAINEINRDEQEKILQATSILLSGEFIPSESYNQATTSLSQSLTRSSTVINPLLSNQVISPLLSNQINSLLNSDVSRFDIDFNLNAYNEVDLGIALRLYNDRLILRREGQITGGQEATVGDRIGDLNATYRINKGLSITAFHRQDQTLGTVSGSSQTGEVTPTVDGLGLEAEIQFNTWQSLSRKIRNTFGKLFGNKKTKEDKEELASDESEKDN
ncbi:MAG: hypothetical protein U5J95_05150 [Balneolaceae bacterium]|nr:hypothetical protein [Balneolaceae bacterium]